MSLRDRPLVILGMFRSGTSSVAAAFAKLGFFLGREADFFEADEQNQGGYYELKDVMAANRQALASLRMSYHRVGPLPDAWRELPGMGRILGILDATLEKHFAGQEAWGWKEPMTSVLLPLYHAVCERRKWTPHFVVCVRNPLEVVASERKRDPLVGDRAFGLWLHYTLSALRETNGRSRSLVLYEGFLSDTRSRLEPAIVALGAAPSNEQWEAACGSVSDKQRHHVHDLAELAGWPAIVGETYRLCQEMDADPAGFSEGAYNGRIEDLWLAHGRHQRVYVEQGFETAKIRLSWERGGKAEGVSAVYAPTGGWQSFRGIIRAEPGTVLRADLYQGPSRIWLRKAIWWQGDRRSDAQLVQGETGWLEVLDGLSCVTVFGPSPLGIRVPQGESGLELELEFLVESDFDTLSRILVRFRQVLDSLAAKGQGYR